jgi:hypothetical protein
MPLNRVVAIATAILTLALAVVPVLGNFDWTSTAGILAGIGAIGAVAVKWLEGWQKWETVTTLQTEVVEPGDGVKHSGLA